MTPIRQVKYINTTYSILKGQIVARKKSLNIKPNSVCTLTLTAIIP